MLYYLRAVCSTVDGGTNQDTRLAGALAFKVLAGLAICTSPWPLFVVACESQTDKQRIEILRTLDRMDEGRKIGIVFVMWSMIESYWKQQDPHADDDRSKALRWWELINLDTAAPWFI